MKQNIQDEFIKSCLQYWDQNLNKITYCLSLLSEEQIWQQPNSVTNSIGNLILHLCGNISQYILGTLGAKNYHRNRNAEFTNNVQFSKTVLLNQLTNIVDEARNIAGECTSTKLLKNYSVQIYEMNGVAILIHVTEHFSYHVGQIALLTKQITEKDLGFYASLT
ncbi:MAG: DUF1572 family protein [Bacteroidota bacterium]|jgi:uncharacterized damage-inducible protein DinB|nr:DUF1572 family protein [Bacteroidota bacterium]